MWSLGQGLTTLAAMRIRQNVGREKSKDIDEGQIAMLCVLHFNLGVEGQIAKCKTIK